MPRPGNAETRARKNLKLGSTRTGNGQSSAHSGCSPLALAERLRQRRAARFLARLRQAVLPVALLLAAWSSGASLRAASITATLQPSEVAFGDSAQLTVTVQGQDENAPEVPAVSGLSFQPVGQSSQIQIINGAMSANVSHTYVVTPSRLGAFTIPAIKVGSGRDVAESRPLVLKVLKRVAAGPPAAPRGAHGQSALPAPTVSGSDDVVVAPDQHSFGFLRLVAPKREYYVGELVPVELKAFFRAGVELRVDGLPRLNSDAFTMNKLSDQPARGQQVIGGVPYTVFTWSTAITAVKAGEYEMSVEIPTTVTVRQRVQRPRTGGGNPFGDSLFDEVFNDAFFDNFFGSARQKEIALSSQPSAVKILSLPTENRPASFTGAVGQFELSSEAAPMQAAAGDPVTLKLRITGVGNFDRVNAPALEQSETWKSYKSSARFEPEDSTGSSGAKTFEQALVPMQTGKVEIPALPFSFFDPQAKQYVTRSTMPVNIEVAHGQTVSAPQTRHEPAAAVAAPPAATAVPGMVPNQLAPGRLKATLRPWFFNPWLAAGSLLPSVALVAAYCGIRRRQRLASDPEHLRRVNAQRAIQAQLKNMESAAAQGVASEFFAAARGALQNRLSLLLGLPPQTITLADINSRMNGEAEGFRFVFELADEVTYTGRTFPPAELQKWYNLVNAELKRLEAL